MIRDKKPPTLAEVSSMVGSVCKQFGPSALMRLGDGRVEKIDVIPTGSLLLDRALGCGGYPRGRVAEVYGPESSGKTTLALHAIAEAQRLGGVAAFIDAEHALDIKYAAALGVSVPDLLVSQPDCGEHGLEIAETLVRSTNVDIVVIDSVAALVPRDELEGEMGDASMGKHARLMSQALRKLCAVIHRTGSIVMFINQLRMKIGVIYGSPEVTTGGNALKYYASVRLDVRRREQVKDAEGQATGNRTQVKVVKNKLAPPFREASFDIIYGLGIDRVGDLVLAAVEAGVVTKNGAWFIWGGDKLGQGFNNAACVLRESSEMSAKLAAEVAASWA